VNAHRIVSAILDSDDQLLSDLMDVAADPALAGVRFALERGQEFVKRVVDNPAQGGFVLEIVVRPIGGPWALKKGSRMIQIRWTHHSHWGNDKQGGGYFFVKPEQFVPFLRELDELVKLCSMKFASDEQVRKAYYSVIRYRYSAPRKPHARQKYTETGLFAYMR
jgi:hypothetical protein